MRPAFIDKGREYVKFQGPEPAVTGGILWHKLNHLDSPICGNVGPTAKMVAVRVSVRFPEPACKKCAK